jgi:hypothetical protein
MKGFFEPAIQRTKKRNIASGKRNDPPNADVFLCSAETFLQKVLEAVLQ